MAAHITAQVRERAISMLKAGKPPKDAASELGISDNAIYRLRQLLVRNGELPSKSKPTKQAKPVKPSTATGYLVKQLEIIAKMIQAKLPELAQFALTTDGDGAASIEYSVRQVTLVVGSVKL